MESGVREGYFKVFIVDVGLCSSLLKLSIGQLEMEEDLTMVNSGGIAEQVVGQQLRAVRSFYEEPQLYYWTRQEKNAQSEVDFVMQHRHDVVPIEVNASTQGRMRSLHLYMAEKQKDRAVRLYSGFPQKNRVSATVQPQERPVSYELISLPFYLVEQIHRLIDEEN